MIVDYAGGRGRVVEVKPDENMQLVSTLVGIKLLQYSARFLQKYHMWQLRIHIGNYAMQ